MPGWALVRLEQPAPDALLLPDRYGEGHGVLVAVEDDGPTGFVGFPVFFDPNALDEGRTLGEGHYLVKTVALFAVLLADGTVQPLGKWILGEAVKRPEKRTTSGLILPSNKPGEYDEERKLFDWDDLMVGVMRVVALGVAALPEFVGHEQRREWATGPCVYFNASQNGYDAATRRRMNGREWLLLTYADVLGLSAAPVSEVKRRVFMGMQ